VNASRPRRPWPFRCFGTISTDPATTIPLFNGRPVGPVAGFPTPEAGVGQHPPEPTPPSPPAGPVVRGPSVLIRGSQASQPGPPAQAAWCAGQPRLDRVNSAELLRQAREVYFAYLSGGAAAADPLGIVVSNGGGGRVVFDLPVLLPEELFVPIDWLRSRGQGQGRGRTGRGGATPRPSF
jgi:hypothetical protein